MELEDALEPVLSLDPFSKDADSLFVYPVTAEYFRYAFHLLMDSLVLCVHPPGRCLRFYHFLLKTGTFTQIGKLRILKAGVSAFPELLKGFSPHGFRQLPRDGLIDAVVITPDILVGSGGSLFAPLQSKGMHLLGVGSLEPGAALHAADIVGCIQDALFIDRDDECVQVRDPLVLVEDDGTHIVQMDRFFRAVVVMDIGFPSRRVERLIQPFNVPLDPFLKIDPICAGRESHEDFKSVSGIGADLSLSEVRGLDEHFAPDILKKIPVSSAAGSNEFPVHRCPCRIGVRGHVLSRVMPVSMCETGFLYSAEPHDRVRHVCFSISASVYLRMIYQSAKRVLYRLAAYENNMVRSDMFSAEGFDLSQGKQLSPAGISVFFFVRGWHKMES